MAKNNKKKNKKKQDVIAALAVIAIIVLVAVVCALLQRNPEAIRFSKTGRTSFNKKQEAQQAGKMIIMCVTAISVIIVGLFIRSRLNKKRRAEEAKREKEDKMKEFLAAKERVERARRDSFLNAGLSEINKRKENRGTYISDFEEADKSFRDRRNYSIADMERELELEHESLKYVEYEEKNFFARILDKIKSFILKKNTETVDEKNYDDFEEKK